MQFWEGRETGRYIYNDEFKGRYSCIADRGGKVERSGEGRESMQGTQQWRSGRCLPLDAALPSMGHCKTAPGRGSQLE